MPYVFISLLTIAIIIVILIIFGLLLGISTKDIKNNIVALAVSVLVIIITRVVYDIASTLKTVNIEFYVALLGGGLNVIVYRAICNRKK